MVDAVNSPTSPTHPIGGSFSSEHNVVMAQHSLPPNISATRTRASQMSSSMSNSELSKSTTFRGSNDVIVNEQKPQVKALRGEVAKWNPFEDPTPFSQMTEDHIFDAEFDAIRQRGSQSSKFYSYFANGTLNKICLISVLVLCVCILRHCRNSSSFHSIF